MKRTVILYEEVYGAILGENIAILIALWQDAGYEVIELAVKEEESPDLYMNELVRLKEDYLVTFAMAGFAWRALMGQVRYNTLPAMQIHILVGDLPHYDFFLRKEYGIQCFFFTDCPHIFREWKNVYPQIPFLSLIPMLYMAEELTEVEKQRNRDNLRGIIQSVMDFIEKPQVL
ncbi:MAG: hypothetical protein K1W26_17800 [Acetatifactor sp.]